MDIAQLREKAKVLGFSFERGTKRGAGYVLVVDLSPKAAATAAASAPLNVIVGDGLEIPDFLRRYQPRQDQERLAA